VPVPNAENNGALINHPDADIADPSWNTSGVPWHAIYYKDNYARLQRVKACWDPRDVFHHALSIRLPDDAHSSPSMGHDDPHNAARARIDAA
jgi:hypothetical protein